MGTFTPDWLALREPFDHAARSEALLPPLRAALPGERRTLHVVDLGCGAGSNLAWLAPRLGRPQRWTGVDHDPRLLEVASARVRPPGVTFAPLAADLLADLPDLDGVDLLTTSALLDLVSWSWLDRLAEAVAGAGIPLLAVLNVDGRVHLDPVHPADGEVLAAFRSHQHTDRGWGPSPGSRAAPELADRLAARGMAVELARADWTVRPGDRAMLREMVRGLAEAAAEMADDPARVRCWEADRLRLVDAGGLALRVGHLDLLALPSRP